MVPVTVLRGLAASDFVDSAYDAPRYPKNLRLSGGCNDGDPLGGRFTTDATVGRSSHSPLDCH